MNIYPWVRIFKKRIFFKKRKYCWKKPRVKKNFGGHLILVSMFLYFRNIAIHRLCFENFILQFLGILGFSCQLLIPQNRPSVLSSPDTSVCPAPHALLLAKPDFYCYGVHFLWRRSFTSLWNVLSLPSNPLLESHLLSDASSSLQAEAISPSSEFITVHTTLMTFITH